MTANQRRRRIVFWRGSFPVLATFTFLMLAPSLADRVSHKGASSGRYTGTKWTTLNTESCSVFCSN
ncbi:MULTISPECIES: hypothetical protein [unclassified Pseudomonas]|uniref:hypothetical protein n=1 Tax=unclassified Pseudomonas TaxID=196821 RepID=UPI0025EE7439|nr:MULTISPECIES: hypothetical protein [unclassified Pseudomonas]